MRIFAGAYIRWNQEDMEDSRDQEDESKSPLSENKPSIASLPTSSQYPADSYAGLPVPTNPLGSTRVPSVQDISDSSSLGSIKPPQVGVGKPMYIKRGPGPHPIERRGPGRPRKDGAGKSPKPVMGLKKLSGLYIPPTSGNGRGVRGRKKLDGGPFVGGTNSVSATLGDLNLFNHESPPRFIDDTAESDTSSVASSFEKLREEDFSLFPEQWPGKLCALCNLGERSMLGQGELIRIEIPNGFDPHSVSKGLIVSCKSEKDNSSDRSPKQNFSSRRQKGAKIKRLTSQGSLESMYEPVDEVVGYSEEPDLNNIFDLPSGFYYVHISCALWCDNAIRKDDGTFKNLEKEIVRALSQHCNHCGNLGAGITCKAPGCGCTLHFACAAASGGFQEITSRTILCVTHLDLAVGLLGKAANCIVCNNPDGISSLLMCSSCGNHYHSACLALNSDPTIRAGWQCPACKVCQACRQPGDDTKLLPCDACDKVYHIFCLRPALASCPKYSWKCKMCRYCTDCGARTPGSGPSSRWHANFSVCDSCYQQRNKGLACPVCGKAYRHVAQKHMVQCHQCKKYVHDSCDPAADLAAYQSKKEQNPDYEYSCTVCLHGPIVNNSSSANPRVILSLKRSSDKDDGSSESNSMINSFTLSQDSFLSPEDNSLSGTENSNDLNWLEKTQGISVEEIRPPTTSGRGKPLTGSFPRKKLGAGPHPIERRGLGRPKSTDSKQPSLPSANNNRRQRFTELQQRKRGPKPKMRGALFGAAGVGLQRPSIDSSHKCEEEPGVENRLVLCSSRDEFVLQQDVCVMCGAFGNDVEGRLISCSQCGQCYHPFCVNIKVTKVVLQKGWRCLDCTVCEGCGHRHDEARLILCDDCDISFHIYCMDPPLDYVPQGNWKCKWCVVCQLCGSNDPGVGSVWHNNYTLCGPCVSLNNCPVCKSEYSEGELIIQCTRCDRWLHASCDMITNESEAEKCADESYNCVLCRPVDLLPPHRQPPPAPIVKAITPPRSPDLKSRPPQHFVVDGVSLSETGMSHIKSLTMEQPRKKRKKMPNIADMEAGILAAIESVVSGSSNSRPDGTEPDKAVDGASDKDKESVKKKQRNLQKLGIGGFIVRLRGPRFRDEEADAGIENQGSLDGELKPKRKQARKKIKNKIVESFPNYLQEAFFGKTLLDPCKDTDFVSGDENDSEISPVITSDKYVKLSPDELKAIEATKIKKELTEKVKANSVSDQASETRITQNDQQKIQMKHQIKIEEVDDGDDTLQDLLPSDLLDNDLVNTIMNEGDDIKVGDGLEDLSAVDSALGDDGELSLDPTVGGHKDELTDFLSSQFNLESIETGLPSMDSKDVEDIFKGVLTDESQESQDNLFPISSGPPPLPPTQHQTSTNISSTLPTAPSSGPPMLSQQQTINASVVISTPGMQGSPGLSNRSQLQQQNVQQALASPISFPPPSPYHSEYSNSPQFSPAFSEPPSPWPTQVDSEQETPSNYSQRSILKWEADEALGLNATISAVLYANTNHMELKRDFPNWAERSKQIAKIWRGLSTDKRAPYLQKARENRAASRMQKSQQDQDKIVNGPISKQPIRGETNEERQWKQMQVYRQQQQQQQQIVLQEHRLQPSLGEPNKDHLGGGGANMNLNPTPKLQYSTVMGQVQRQLVVSDAPHGTPGSEITRQPLQVSTSHDLNMPGPQSSPHLQSPNSRQVFASTLQSNRPSRPPALEMPPPRMTSQPPQGSPTIRPPMYSRVPYTHSPRQPMASPNDPYANSPMTPQPASVDPYAHLPSTPRPSVTEAEGFSNTSEPYQQKIMQDSYMSCNVSNSSNEMDISGGGLSSPRGQAPQGQETRQHLRDLLQRQQIKKLEQEQMSPNCPEMLSPGTPRPLSWSSQDDWQKSPVDPSVNQNFNQRHQLVSNSPSSPQLQQNQFRHPFLHQHGRFNTPPQQQPIQSINRPLVPDFRPTQPNSQQQQQQQQPQVIDSRVRLMLQQQRGLIQPQQLASRSQLSFPINHQQQQQQQQMNQQGQFRAGIRNTLDPYDHLVVQQRSGIVMSLDGNGPPSGSMLAQQLGRPLNSMAQQQQQQQIPVASPPSIQQHPISTTIASHLSPSSRSSSVTSSSLQTSHVVMSSQADHQELPDSVTAELEKLEQEQHNEGGVEAETGELVDMAIDDDELLGMGADFNILEYADPELDQAVGGEKTNILDNLDLEEEKDEEKEENKDLKRREHENRHVKRETNVSTFSSLGGPAQTSTTSVIKIESTPVATPTNTVGINNSQPNYVQQQQQQQQSAAGEAPILRPPQSGGAGISSPFGQPPPYPVPPPPYPGRTQMGIRNGGGMGLQSMPSMMNMGLKNTQMGMVGNIGGLRPTTQHLPSPPISSSCNPLMTLHQRRTLLLQEQPLLLEDLLEQEKREQQRQGPSLMGAAPEEPLLSDFDFERLKADVLSSSNLPVSLSPPNVSGQVILAPPVQAKFTRGIPSQMNPQMNSQRNSQMNQPGMNQPGMNQPSMNQPSMNQPSMNQPGSTSDWQVESDNVIGNRRNISQPLEHNSIPLHPALAQSSGSNPTVSSVSTNRVPNFSIPLMPAPPTPPEHPTTEQERQMLAQYEKWLYHQQQAIAMQLKFYEGEVNKLRKEKKSLNSKQRQLRKNGAELNDQDTGNLERVLRELSVLQKQLDQSRKQSRQHSLLMQKRQQMIGMNPGGPSQNPSQTPTQASPLGTSSHSPLHSTPQSPILSPSPSMGGGGPVSSPLMQHHSPMASPLTPSPGPVSNLSQTSPRSLGQHMHHMDDRPFSPNNDNSMRGIASPQNNINQNRMVPQQQGNQMQLRMGSPAGGNQQGMMQQSGNILMSGNQGLNQNIMMARGMNANMNSMHSQQQRPMTYVDNQHNMQRMRLNGPQDQMRMMGPGTQRFQRVGVMNQEMMLRPRSHQNQYQNPNQSQMIMSPGGQHYVNVQRVPFPNQSPTGSNNMGIGMVSNLRSPLPMNSMGGLGSPPGSQVMMGQNRVSPASSPMRRPSGSGSLGVGSPLPERPQSVENPLSSLSSPHTPSSMSCSTPLGCGGVDGMNVVQQQQQPSQHSSNDGSHFHSLDNMSPQDSGLGPHGMQNYGMPNVSTYSSTMTTTTHSTTDYNNMGGGGGGGNSQLIPFPTFSWFNGPVKLGLKGGSPFSVVNGSPSSHNSNVVPDQSQGTLDNNLINSESFQPVVNHTSAAIEPRTAASPVVTNTDLVATTATTTAAIITTAITTVAAAVATTAATTTAEANVGVLGGFRPTAKTQAVISQILDQNRQIVQTMSFDPSKLQNISHMQGTPMSLASFVADAVNAASLPFPQASKAVTGGTFVGASVPLITVYSRPEMKNQHTNLTAVLLTSPPRFTTSVVGSQQQGGLTKVTQPGGESQNALLKQLLQNTACASMGQAPTDTTGFSLTSFAKRPSPSIPIHTSQLSEAASRIPQPTPIIRPQVTTATVSQAAPIRLPIKIEVRVSESLPLSTPQLSTPQLPPPPATPQVIKSPRIVEENVKQSLPTPPPPPPPPQTPPVVVQTAEEKLISEPPKESVINKLDPITISANAKETIDAVASEKSSFETAVLDAKKADDEVKKAKRRQYQAKRRQSMGKEHNPTPKKRMRKGSKLEEDYDSYMENLITQIRQLPPVGIVEPELGRNYNVCPFFGAGDYSKVNTKGYDLQYGDLTGSFGHATVNSQPDYYNTRPFGPASFHPSSKSQPTTTQRGFYNQEFASPKLGSYDKRRCDDDRSPTPFRDCDTPDTIVSSSSPECVMHENSNMYPGLKLIDDDEEERRRHLRDSPIIPIIAPIPIRPVQAEQLPKTIVDDIDKENRNTIAETFVMKGKGTSGAMSPLKDSGNMTVTLTLSSNAAEDIGGVLRNLASALSISAPTVYQIVERTTTPPSQKLGLYTYKGKDGKEFVDIQGILNGAAKFCRHCDVVVLSNVIRKKIRDLPGITSDEDSLDGTDELYFCSTTCFMQFAMTHGVTLPNTTDDKAGAVVRHPSEMGCQGVVNQSEKLVSKDSRLTLLEADIMKSIKEKSNKVQSENETVNSEPSGKLKRQHPSNEVKVKEESEVPGKKWKGIKYKTWLPNATPHTKYKKPTDKEMTEMLFRMKITVAPAKIPDDIRKCMFCHQTGDGVSDGPARLLNYDVDKWVHLNCALWSEEVYETENGALVNVESALKQSVVLICIACKANGATVKCFKTRCSSVYHLGCAVKEGCVFYKNKAVYCSAHVPKGEKENELTTLSVGRRVYIQRDENRQVAAVMHHADQHHLLRVGSLIFLNVGQLLPHQLQNFHTASCIYPIGYKIVRFYWSMKRPNKRCQYICSIHEVEAKPEFRIQPQEEGFSKDVIFKADTAQGAWHQVLDAISKVRNASNTIKVFPKYITGEDLFGLTEPAIVKVLESLPGIETLTDYHFKYGRNPLLELPLAINPTGCARGEPKLRTHFKRPHTQRTGGSGRTPSAMTSSVLSSSEAACPYSKQFVHSKSSQYKKMKQEWRNNVYLARSKIQGLGLYAARDIEKHTMVIEYIGEIIRSELAELREKKYEDQNRGIYMFRVDEDRVIDATLCGGLARYINHSCSPNCVAETVEVDRDWRIIIFANRRISRGEELAYDYKFEFEDDQHKIQCFCGSKNCRQWMN